MLRLPTVLCDGLHEALVAEAERPAATVVTLACDSGLRYLSTDTDRKGGRA